MATGGKGGEGPQPGETRILDRTPATGLPEPECIGEYEVVQHLGEGGMGAVMLCRDRELRRQVAIKLIRPELLGNEDFINRFLREARLSAALNHPNVVTTYQVGRHKGCPYLVLEYIDGKTLRDLLRTPPPIPIERILEIHAQCCDGLDAAARQGIVHRDVKPANIMVRQDGLVKVMDFGLSKQLGGDQVTISNAIMGTPDYMAPEQAAGRPVDFRADIYSLGICLFQCLSGYIPFRASSVWETIAKHAKEPLPEDSRIQEIAGGKLWDLIVRMTAKEPEGRPSSYASIRDELRGIREVMLKSGDAGQSVSLPSALFGETAVVGDRQATPPTAPRQKSGSRARRPAAKQKGRGLVVAGVLAGALVLAGAAWFVMEGGAAAKPALLPPVEATPAAPREIIPAKPPPSTVRGVFTMRSSRGAVVEDVLKQLGVFGLNYMLAPALPTRRVPVACSFKERRTTEVFGALRLAAGWGIDDSDGIHHISQLPAHHPGDAVALHREKIDLAALPLVSISTVHGRRTLRDVCEAINLEGGLDYLILMDLADKQVADVSLTEFPLGRALEVLQREGLKFEWTVQDSILVIVPPNPRTR